MVLMRLGRLTRLPRTPKTYFTSRDFVRRWGNRLGKAARPEPFVQTQLEHEALSDSFYVVSLHRNKLTRTIRKLLVSPEGSRTKLAVWTIKRPRLRDRAKT